MSEQDGDANPPDTDLQQTNQEKIRGQRRELLCVGSDHTVTGDQQSKKKAVVHQDASL